MSTTEQAKRVKEAQDSLRRIQEFDPKSIARVDELGRDLNLRDGVAPLERTLSLFREVSLDVLADMSAQRLDITKQQSDALYNQLQQILKFSVTQGNPKQQRDSFVEQLENSYDHYFEQLWPSVAYSVRRSTDFARMEHEARAAVQAIQDRTDSLESDLRRRADEAESALEAIRKVAAEQGVRRQPASPNTTQKKARRCRW